MTATGDGTPAAALAAGAAVPPGQAAEAVAALDRVHRLPALLPAPLPRTPGSAGSYPLSCS
ncbi:MAG: hypothetical protein ACLPS1_28765 [Streptosporangiaceae bacterium]